MEMALHFQLHLWLQYNLTGTGLYDIKPEILLPPDCPESDKYFSSSNSKPDFNIVKLLLAFSNQVIIALFEGALPVTPASYRHSQTLHLVFYPQ
jgi:hypothetical protein